MPNTPPDKRPAQDKLKTKFVADAELRQIINSNIGEPSPLSKVVEVKTAAGVSRLAPSISATNHTLNACSFWCLVLLSLILAQVPIVGWLFTPINQFTTMVHELSHAFVCIVTGGWVTGLTVVGDGAGHGGLTFCHGGLPFFYTQAGYLGTAIFGSLLVFLGQYPKLSKATLVLLGTAIGLASIFLVGANLFNTGFAGFLSLLWGVAMSVFLIWAGLKWKPSAANLLLLFLAVQTALNSVVCIYYLVQIYFGFVPSSAAWSDATSMSQMTGGLIPPFVWSLLWFVMSISLLSVTLWHTYGKRIFRPQIMRARKKL
jgi:hypothetical protein